MDGGVQIISRRMVRPAPASHHESSEPKDVHLTPWDLAALPLDYIQEVTEKGLGWAAWLLNRTVASFDETGIRSSLARWPLQPTFAKRWTLSEPDAAMVFTGSSPRFDVYGCDFGWGRPLAVRSGPGAKADGKATVYEGEEGGGRMALEVCLAPDVLARLVADGEFMAAVSAA